MNHPSIYRRQTPARKEGFSIDGTMDSSLDAVPFPFTIEGVATVFQFFQDGEWQWAVRTVDEIIVRGEQVDRESPVFPWLADFVRHVIEEEGI